MELTPAQFAALVKRKIVSDEREDLRAGMICAVIANVNRNPKKRLAPFEPGDFFSIGESPKKRKKAQTWEEQLAVVEMLNAAFGGIDERPKVVN